jgi:hypothetical protein
MGIAAHGEEIVLCQVNGQPAASIRMSSSREVRSPPEALDCRVAGDPAGGGGEGSATLSESGAIKVDASANGWVSNDAYGLFGMQFIEFVQRCRQKDPDERRDKKTVVVNNCAVHSQIARCGIPGFRVQPDSLPLPLTRAMQVVYVVRTKLCGGKVLRCISVVGTRLKTAFDVLGAVLAGANV